jgi:hypothetical protein
VRKVDNDESTCMSFCVLNGKKASANPTDTGEQMTCIFDCLHLSLAARYLSSVCARNFLFRQSFVSTFLFWSITVKTLSILSAVILASTLGGTAFASERDTPAAAAPARSEASRADVHAEAVRANAASLRIGASERQPFVFMAREDKAPAQGLSRETVREEAIKSAEMGARYDGLYSRG